MTFRLVGDMRALTTPFATTLLLMLITAALAVRRFRKSRFPLINDYPNDLFRNKARAAYTVSALELIQSGLRNYAGQPFRIITALGDRIILPHSWIQFVKAHPDLDHQAQVAEEFFGRYPGFEAIGVFNDPRKILIDLTKQRLSSVTPSILASIQKEVDVVLDEILPAGPGWSTLDCPAACNRLVAVASSSIFVGPRLGRDSEWLSLIQSYTFNMFFAARVLRSWPASLRPLVHWILPECKQLRAQMASARATLNTFELGEPEANTVFAWLKDADVDMAAIQLGIAAGGLHTTAQLLQQTLLDLCVSFASNSALIEDLRRELSHNLSLSNGVLTAAVLSKLDLLDACIKESQRLKPQVMVNLERMALKDIVLPNGQTIARNTQIAIPTLPMFNTELYGNDGEQYNPYRWMKEDANISQNKLVSSSAQHYAFGMGRFICPGRFFAAAEIKIILATMLLKWDFKISDGEQDKIEGGRVKWKGVGFEMLTEWEIEVEARRRSLST